jgi:ribosome biogenesis GTPase
MPSQNDLHGRITQAHGRHYVVELADGTTRICFPRGKKAGAAVGDYVGIQPQGLQEGVIETTCERRNLLYRSDEFRTKVFAANVDQLLIIVAVEPAFSDDLLGRALVAAASADIKPIVILNKTDLSDGLPAARARLGWLADAGITLVELSALDPEQVRQRLRPALAGTNLLLGQSGMGKSTLLNILVPHATAQTQEHSQALGTGKHTTTSTRLYHLPDSRADIIDSPGFQAFGLYHLGAGDIERGFPEFNDYLPQCRFYNCTHRHEPGCAVLKAVEGGGIPRDRHDLYKRILAENEKKTRY